MWDFQEELIMFFSHFAQDVPYLIMQGGSKVEDILQKNLEVEN